MANPLLLKIVFDCIIMTFLSKHELRYQRIWCFILIQKCILQEIIWLNCGRPLLHWQVTYNGLDQILIQIDWFNQRFSSNSQHFNINLMRKPTQTNILKPKCTGPLITHFCRNFQNQAMKPVVHYLPCMIIWLTTVH